MTDHMIDAPLEYFSRWMPSRSDLMKALEAEARKEQIPIIGPVVGQLLYILTRIHRPKTILELGTATGYSTILLARACRDTGGRVISFEIEPELIRRAQANLSRAGLSHLVEIRGENALTALAQLPPPVDMIFMDIEKEDYVRALPDCTRLTGPGGVLVADNTGFKDAHRFNQAIHEDSAWEAVNIWSFLPGHSPEHDGICVALRR